MRGGKTGEVKGRKGGGDVRIRRLQDLFGREHRRARREVGAEVAAAQGTNPQWNWACTMFQWLYCIVQLRLAMTKITASRRLMYYLSVSRYMVPWMRCTLQALDLLVHRGTGRRETNPRSRGRKAR